MSAPLVILILSLLLGLQPLTTDLYLPALPTLTSSLGAQPAQAQNTLTALVLAFGLSQLFWGPLSDRYGRRPILLAGLVGYTIAAIGSFLAPTIESLTWWRILQGACMGAGTVCARAIVRDLYPPLEGARVMSKGLSGLGVAACLGPALGGLISQAFGWRATLFTLTLIGGLTLVIVWRHFQESLPTRQIDALRPSRLASTVIEILRHPNFWGFALLSSFSLAGLYTYLLASSFIFIELHAVSKTSYGLLLLSVSLFYIIGTMLCRRVIVRFGLKYAVRIGGLLSVLGGGLMLGLPALGVGDAWTLLLPIWIYMLGHGFHQPCGQSGAIAPFPKTAGAASALTGSLMMAIAFTAGRWIGQHMDGTAQPMINAIFVCSLLLSVLAWLILPRLVPATASPASATTK